MDGAADDVYPCIAIAFLPHFPRNLFFFNGMLEEEVLIIHYSSLVYIYTRDIGDCFLFGVVGRADFCHTTALIS